MSNLKGYRVLAGYTQEEFSSLLGISRVMYCYKETGTRAFSEEERKRILHHLNKKIPSLTMEELFPIGE